MKYIKLFVITLLTSCNGISVEHLTDNYYLTKMDYEANNRSLSYKLGKGSYLGVVNATIFAVGYNDDFIIVKQHPRSFPNPPDTNMTNYYVVPLKFKVNHWADENKFGPLTLEEFLIKRKELEISDDLEFSVVFQK